MAGGCSFFFTKLSTVPRRNNNLALMGNKRLGVSIPDTSSSGLNPGHKFLCGLKDFFFKTYFKRSLQHLER